MNLPNNEWFENPLDRMPLATDGTNRYAPPAKMEELESNPIPEEEVADWFSDKKEKPDESDEIEEEKTIHQKMYEMATQKHSPWKGGGSENFQGGSERINGTE